MATTDTNLADHTGGLVESHKGYDPRIIFFYFVLAGLLLTLVVGLAYQQLSKTGEHANAERQQNQRRVLVPGPRGNIYDRSHRLLVGNRPRFSVRLRLDELRPEIRREQIRIRKNYREMDDKNVPSAWQLEQIARVSVVQRYLDEVNRIIGRNEKVDGRELQRHFSRELLLPFTLIDDLEGPEYARLLEGLPVTSPASVYSFSTRYYPFGSAASHTLGYIGSSDDVEVEDLPGDDLKTFKMKGTMGRAGIEQRFDSILQGEAGGSIFRVDPSGNRVYPAIQVVNPKQGRDVTLSLDIDLQMAAEKELAVTEMAGAAVVLDVATGEVLVLASKPDYDLAQFSPRITPAAWADANERGALFSRAIQGVYPPGSSFKVLMTIAGLRSGVITPDSMTSCPGYYRLGRAQFDCHDRHAHGDIGLEEAIERSCNVFFYDHGYQMGPEVIASEARRFHLDRPTGIELPYETRRMLIPSPEWKKKELKQAWVGGDTVLESIGQGYVAVSPLQMACFTASVARNEVWTQPTLIHQPNRPRQHTESIGLTPEQRASLMHGMERVTTGASGTARILQNGQGLPPLTGLRIAAKTGTAQAYSAKGRINFAWLLAFAPIEDPKIAIAIAIEGDTPGEEVGGGRYASPVAHAIFRTWLDQKAKPAGTPVKFKTE